MERWMRQTLALIVSLCVLLPVAPASAGDPFEPRVLFSDPQPHNGGLAGHAEMDGTPGEEALMATLSGGFSVVRGDGTILWRHPLEQWSRPRLIPDSDGDGRQDVAAEVGFPGDPGRVLVLSGATGAVLRDIPMHSPVGRISVGDLNGDGVSDLLVPSVDGEIHLVALFGPGFESGWDVKLPGTLSAYWVFGQSIDVGQLDADPAAEIVFGTRLSANSGGKLHVLDGRDGSQQWVADTGAVFDVRIAGGQVVAFVWRSLAVTFGGELVAYPGGGGAPVWTVPTAGYIKRAAMQIGDVDGDGVQEAVLALTNAQEGTVLAGLDPTTMIVHAIGLDGRPRWVQKATREIGALELVSRTGGGMDVLFGTDAWFSSIPDEQVGLLSGLTGAPLWVRIHPGEVMDDAINYVGRFDFDGDGAAEVVHSSVEQKLWALSPADGTFRFRRAYPGVSTAAATGDVDGDGTLEVVVGGADGLVRMLGEDGVGRWSANLGGAIGGLDVQAGLVRVVRLGVDASVLALRVADGSVAWSFATGVASEATFGDSHQAFADLDGDGMRDAIIGGSQNLRPTVVAVNGRTGTQLWRSISPVLPPGSQPATTAGTAQALSVVGEDVATTFSSAEHNVTPRVALLDGVSGTALWTAQSVADMEAEFFQLGDKVVAVTDTRISGLRLSDGSEAWAIDVGRPMLVAPLGGKLLVVERYRYDRKTLVGFLLDAAGGQEAFADAAVIAPAAMNVVPGAGVVHATRKGVQVLDATALASAEVQVRFTLPLRAYTNLNGDRFDVPSVTTIVPGAAGEGAYALGRGDIEYLNGQGGEVPGLWLARLA